jgi:hypothetical protein
MPMNVQIQLDPKRWQKETAASCGAGPTGASVGPDPLHARSPYAQ